jgi:HSP20 family protein
MQAMQAEIDRMFASAFHATQRMAAGGDDTGAVTNAPSGLPPMPPDPSECMRRIQDEVDMLFNRACDDVQHFGQHPGFDDGWGELAVTPSMNVQDDGRAYTITLSLPGFAKSDIHVGLSGTLLTIVAQATSGQATQNVASSNGARVWSTGRFERRLRLPYASLRTDGVRATFENDVLRIVIPKAESPPATKPIPVL